MTVEEHDIQNLTPWSGSTMALLSLRGVKFKLVGTRAVQVWEARWRMPDEHNERQLVDMALWKLVHKVAIAIGNREL
jgi:hypothetical protein